MNWKFWQRKPKPKSEDFERSMWSSWADSEADLMPEEMRKEYLDSRRRVKENQEDKKND